MQYVAGCCSVLHVLQDVAVCCGVLQCIAGWYSVLQRVAVCYSAREKETRTQLNGNEYE